MPIHIAFNEEKNYLLVTYQSPLGKGAVVDAVADITKAAFHHGTHRVIADCREMTEQQDILELFQLVQNMIKQGVPFYMREALILPTDKSIVPSVNNYKLFSENRGFHVEEFDSFEEGEAWLTSE